MIQDDKSKIRSDYDSKARKFVHKVVDLEQKRAHPTFKLRGFNNWIKAVLIQKESKKLCESLKADSLSKEAKKSLLNVLDIACGRGQDILKWKEASVANMVANDFSQSCVKAYEERWRQANKPYSLLTINQDFTSLDLYDKVKHLFYHIVSAQFCFHYMFSSQKALNNGLYSILTNLHVGGIFMATIPDKDVIWKKVNQEGKVQLDGSKIFGNKYYSIKFE